MPVGWQSLYDAPPTAVYTEERVEVKDVLGVRQHMAFPPATVPVEQ